MKTKINIKYVAGLILGMFIGYIALAGIIFLLKLMQY